MNDKKCIFSTLAAFVVMSVIGFVAYEYLLAGFMDANMGSAQGVQRDPVSMWQILFAQLMGAGLLATVLSWKGADTPADGFKGGACVGLLMSLFFGFMMLGTTNVSTMPLVLVDAVVSVVTMGVAGAVVGMVRGRV